MNIKQAFIVLIVCIFTLLINYGYLNNYKVDVTKEQISEKETIIEEDTIEEIKTTNTESIEFEYSEEKIINNSKEVVKPETSNNNNQKNITNTEPKENNHNVEIKEEIINEPITNNDNNEVDISNFMYSIHKGVIDYSSLESCASRGKEIAMNNIIDVLYFNCVEVNSKGNTILGYYLDIVCETGNCSKYK